MAASILPEPGSQHGPCVPPCGHRDCAATKRMVQQVCRFCDKPIGFGVRFYDDPDRTGELVHADCFEDSISGQ